MRKYNIKCPIRQSNREHTVVPNLLNKEFKNTTKKYKLGQSMSRNENCWDNAPQELFWPYEG